MNKKNYTDSVHFSGRVWCLIALIAFLAVPLAISLKHGWPALSTILSGLLAIIIFPITGVIEVITYSPLLGPGATYLSFITGNIANLKLPCALNAVESADVNTNSEEGDVIKTIAIATSSIVTTVIIALCVLAFAVNPKFSELMNSETLKPAFEQVALTVFGALAASYFVKHWKICIFPIAACALILAFVPGMDFGVMIFAGVILSILGAHTMYKLKWV